MLFLVEVIFIGFSFPTFEKYPLRVCKRFQAY